MKISSRLLARWIYQAVLYLYPPKFRREFGAQMRQDFALVYRSYRQRPKWHQRAAFWVLIGKDVIGSLGREYRALLPSPRGWWWLRLVGLVAVGIGIFSALSLFELVTDAWLLPDRYSVEWWWFCMPLSTFGIALPLSFGLWTLPSWRLQPLVRGLSVLFALVKVIPEVLWFIWLKKVHAAQRPLDPLLGAWEPFIYTLLFGISLATILILSCISLRKPSHRWWSIAMVMIYVAPWLTYRIASVGGYIPHGPNVDHDTYMNAMRILSSGTYMLTALGWMFFGIKIWMSVPRRVKQGQVAAAG
jgi:hypothetical protein